MSVFILCFFVQDPEGDFCLIFNQPRTAKSKAILSRFCPQLRHSSPFCRENEFCGDDLQKIRLFQNWQSRDIYFKSRKIELKRGQKSLFLISPLGKRKLVLLVVGWRSEGLLQFRVTRDIGEKGPKSWITFASLSQGNSYSVTPKVVQIPLESNVKTLKTFKGLAKGIWKLIW